MIKYSCIMFFSNAIALKLTIYFLVFLLQLYLSVSDLVGEIWEGSAIFAGQVWPTWLTRGEVGFGGVFCIRLTSEEVGGPILEVHQLPVYWITPDISSCILHPKIPRLIHCKNRFWGIPESLF